MADYLQALQQEFKMVLDQLAQAQLQPRTIYLGGGTPSVLDMAQLEQLLQLIRQYCSFQQLQEYTVEVNPGTVNEVKLQLLKAMGVNRLSVGVQSFDDNCLKALGRIHSAKEAAEAIALAQTVGFENISLDLMYGLPGQTMELLQDSVQQAVATGVQHISIYGLQLEEGTVFAKLQEQGRLQLPEEELTEAMYDYLTEAIPKAGYQRYEISNFAQPGRESQHNMSYWQDVPYLGFGSGAHGYWQGTRYENPVDIPQYIAEIQQGKVMSHIEETVHPTAHMEEFCFLGLRTAAGIDKKKFLVTFGKELQQVYGAEIARLQEQGLLQETETAVSLTALGMKYGNQAFQEFIK